MGIKAKFTKADIRNQMAATVRFMKDAIISRLQEAGWEFVKIARELVTYNDVTGNLRSSIGFVIVDHGDIIDGDFELAKKGTDRETGLREAEKLTKELASKYSNSYALIVVAGMDYAASVESKGKDVITGSSVVIEASLKQAMENLKNKSQK